MLRTQKRNRQKMYYAVPVGRVPKYKLDDNGEVIYMDIDGELVPVETGEYEEGFGKAVPFRGAIFSQLENAIVRAWGNDNTNNYAVLVVSKDAYPELKNGVRIWRNTKVKKDSTGKVDGSSADYIIAGTLTEELNEDSYYLKVLGGGADA